MANHKKIGNEKTCGVCKVTKHVSEFYKAKSGSLGVQSFCKLCTDQRTIAYRQDNAAKMKVWAKSYYRRNLPKKMLSQAKIRAEANDLAFDLIESDIVIPEFCPVLGIKLCISDRGNGPSDESPSLDRIIPEKGYVKGNTVVISQRANSIKRNASLEEIEKLYLWLKNLL